MLYLILAAAIQAFTPSDLDGSVAVAQGICAHEGGQVDCFRVVKDDKKYIVLVDEKGILIVYGVDVFKQQYNEGEIRFLYSRNSI